MIIEKFREILDRTVHVSQEDLQAPMEELVEAITSSEKKRRGRDQEAVEASTRKGLVNEIGIAKILGKRNPLAWNHRIRASYAWDVMDDLHHHRHEVKSQTQKYWSVFPDYVSTLIRSINAAAVDTIITATHIEEGDGYLVIPKLIINPATFRMYLNRSEYERGGYFYNHKSAAFDSECIVFNSEFQS